MTFHGLSFVVDVIFFIFIVVVAFAVVVVIIFAVVDVVVVVDLAIVLVVVIFFVVSFINWCWLKSSKSLKLKQDPIWAIILHVPCLSSIPNTAEPNYSYNGYSRFLAIVELNLVPFAIISLLFYPCYSRLLF